MFESSRAHHPHPTLQEIEIKLRLSSVSAAKRLLRQKGFVVTTPRHRESNLLLDSTPATLRPAGSLLRVRQANGETVITYKDRGVTAGGHKVREELEVTASDPKQTLAIFARLGYTPNFRYDKFRTVLARPKERGYAMLDETPIGVFLELEGGAKWIDRTAKRLGFTAADYLTASYGALWAAHLQAAGLPPADFIFPPRRKS
ncbi:MAG: class IV adenylate cyclase [Bryobacteraceae bacterium]|nr:class IV adenylate cyclase [Bryobacteraceae bacterium]